MLISMDILTHELKDYVSYSHLLENTKLEIAYCQLLDDSFSEYSAEFVYISADTPSPESMPSGTNLVCVGSPPDHVDQFHHLNLIVLSGINSTRAINMIFYVLRKYSNLEDRLEQTFRSSARLQEIINIATELVGVPLCMIDLNHSVLALSTNLEPVGDSLWDAMREGYGYLHYSIVAVSIPNLSKMDEKGSNVYDGISNISGRFIRVYLLRRGAKGVAALGLHKNTDCTHPFERYTLQLADFFVSHLISRLGMFSEVKMGRGKLYEQFLNDLLDGKFTKTDAIMQTMKDLSLKCAPKYVLGMVCFKRPTEQTDYHFALMDYIEAILPDCKCAMHKKRIVFLYPLFNGSLLPRQMHSELPEFLDKHDCFCILSSPFPSLTEVPAIWKTLDAVIPYITITETSAVQLYHYYQFALMHALHLLSQVVPLSEACHSSLLRLMNYDRTNNSNYYETFVEYLHDNCNITETANALHIHRNSLLYRISKLEELLGENLNDSELREQFLFSIKCVEYEQRYGSGEILLNNKREVVKNE